MNAIVILLAMAFCALFVTAIVFAFIRVRARGKSDPDGGWEGSINTSTGDSVQHHATDQHATHHGSDSSAGHHGGFDGGHGGDFGGGGHH